MNVLKIEPVVDPIETLGWWMISWNNRPIVEHELHEVM